MILRRWYAKQRAIATRNGCWPQPLLAPNLILLAVFTYRPLLDNIRLSFSIGIFSSPTSTFVGLDNYVEWFSREDTKTIVLNTVVFTFFAVIGSMVIGLALALLLNQNIKGRNFARSVVFAPYAISGAAIGIAFQFVFDPNFGLIQDMLGLVRHRLPEFLCRARLGNVHGDVHLRVEKPWIYLCHLSSHTPRPRQGTG